MDVKIKSLAISKKVFEDCINSLYLIFEEHCMKYQLFSCDTFIKEIYSYSSLWGKRIIKTTNKFPSKEMLLKTIMENLDGEERYEGELLRTYEDFKDCYPAVDFDNLDTHKMYNNYLKFLDEWCSFLEKGRNNFSFAICKNLAKKYL